jgi:hypothetical protein
VKVAGRATYSPASQVLPERVLPELCHLQAESPIPGKSDNKTSAGGGLSPNVAAVIENSPAGEGQPKPEAVLLAGRDERLEQPVANPMRNARPRIFDYRFPRPSMPHWMLQR